MLVSRPMHAGLRLGADGSTRRPCLTSGCAAVRYRPGRAANGHGREAPNDVTTLCPECDYNLTGIAEPRCPECGAAVARFDLARAGPEPPRTAFERASGVLGTLSLFQTALTVIFTPWIFARQIQHRASLPHAFAFFVMCLSMTFLSLPFLQASYVYEWDFLVAWLVGGVACVLIQAALFVPLDPAGWDRPRQAFRYWLVAGCYTSAVMMTEFVYGPPRLPLSDMLEPLDAANRPPRLGLALRDVVWLLQLTSWIAAVTACYLQRLRRARMSGPWLAAAAIATPIALLLLYSAVFEHVGERVYHALG